MVYPATLTIDQGFPEREPIQQLLNMPSTPSGCTTAVTRGLKKKKKRATVSPESTFEEEQLSDILLPQFNLHLVLFS